LGGGGFDHTTPKGSREKKLGKGKTANDGGREKGRTLLGKDIRAAKETKLAMKKGGHARRRGGFLTP